MAEARNKWMEEGAAIMRGLLSNPAAYTVHLEHNVKVAKDWLSREPKEG